MIRSFRRWRIRRMMGRQFGPYRGVPYVWGGGDPCDPFDCSDLVDRVWDEIGRA